VVPTPLMKTGNFTELSQTLHDSGVAGQAGCVAGNIVASGCLDSTATQLVALFRIQIFSQVAKEGIPGVGTEPLTTNYSVPKDTQSWDVQIDHNLTSKVPFRTCSQYIISNQDHPGPVTSSRNGLLRRPTIFTALCGSGVGPR
jgi:hypothetical protein